MFRTSQKLPQFSCSQEPTAVAQADMTVPNDRWKTEAELRSEVTSVRPLGARSGTQPADPCPALLVLDHGSHSLFMSAPVT